MVLRIFLAIVFFQHIISATAQVNKTQNKSMLTPWEKPELFSNLGKSCTTPDGFALDKDGNLYLSVPNYNSYKENGSKILKFDANDRPLPWIENLPEHPETGQVHPMGMEFGPDSNLYIADNQYFLNNGHKSRLLRVVVKKGKPLKTEVVAEGFLLANAVRWFGNKIYVSDTFLEDPEKTNQSGVFVFDIKEFEGKPVLLNRRNDKHLLCSFTTKDLVKDRPDSGADGMAFDKKGNLYVGNFGDGVVTQVKFDSKRNYQSQKIILDSDDFRCCDGIFYYPETNSLFLANFMNNSILLIDVATNKTRVIWENGDTNGAEGLLDQPCEMVVYKDKLLVVNFDAFVAGKNKEADDFHTLSQFKLPLKKTNH